MMAFEMIMEIQASQKKKKTAYDSWIPSFPKCSGHTFWRIRGASAETGSITPDDAFPRGVGEIHVSHSEPQKADQTE